MTPGWMARILVLVSTLVACTIPSSRKTLGELEAEQDRQADRLSRIQAEIAESERRAEEARKRAAYEQCRATAASIDAGLAIRRAECAHEVAEQQACLARQERDVTDAALGGCGLGLLAGVLSGGTLAPWVLAGCGIGLAGGEVSRDTCPSPVCVGEMDEWLTLEVAEHERDGLPVCRASVELDDVIIYLPSAIRVTSVVRGSAAERAGLAANDILLRIDGRYVPTQNALRAALDAAPLDEKVTITYLRRQIVLAGRAIIESADQMGGGRRLLGIRHVEEDDVRYSGVRVVAADERSSLRTGDLLLAIDRIPVIDARTVMSMVERNGVSTVLVERDGAILEITIEASP